MNGVCGVHGDEVHGGGQSLVRIQVRMRTHCIVDLHVQPETQHRMFRPYKLIIYISETEQTCSKAEHFL